MYGGGAGSFFAEEGCRGDGGSCGDRMMDVC